ncbi:ATP-binding protein [Pseudonocardia sp. DLS-67]
MAEALNLDEAEVAELGAAGRDHGDPTVREGSSGPPITSSSMADLPRQLPAAPPAFTGRVAELADLDRAPDAATVVITAIDGMAGIGKTAVAVQAAHRLQGHYPDGQLFIDLHGYTEGVRPVSPEAALDRLLRALGVPAEQVPRELDDRAALFRSWLADRKVLILLDNAADEAQVMPLLPGTPGCLALVTSRRRLFGLDSSHTISLDVLPLSDAVALFSRTAGETRLGAGSTELLVEAVELCGRLPLAIRIAGARLRSRQSWTLEHLLERLRDLRRRSAELDGGERSVAAALGLSYQQLTVRPRLMFRLLGLHPGAEFDARAAAALAGVTPTEAGRLVDQLVDSHLLLEPAPGRYRFHDLVRGYAVAVVGREASDEVRQDASTRLFDHYCYAASLAMDAAYPYERERRPRPTTSDPPVPELDDPAMAAAWLDAELPNLLAVARQAGADHTLHLATTVNLHLRMRSHYVDAEELLEQALRIASDAGSRADELDARIGLGNVYRVQARHDDAIDMFQQALKIARVVDVPAGELDVLTGLGDAHRSRGEYARAAEYFEGAQTVALRIANRTRQLEALIGLGWIRVSEGELSMAADAFEQVVRVSRDTGHRPFELHALRGMGHIHRINGRYAEAIGCFEQALEISRAVGTKYGMLGVLIGLGWIHRLEGRHDQAADCYEQALRLARGIRSSNFEYEALQGLGRLYGAEGSIEEAITYHRKALDIATTLGQAGDRARAHDGLGRSYRSLNEPDLARQHWSSALAILDGLGAAHTDDDEVTSAAIRSHLGNLDGPSTASS